MCKKIFITVLCLIIFGGTGFTQEEGISGDIFGKQRRNIHPAAALGFEYTDNLYNSSEDEESDYSVVFSPSVSLSIPGSRDVEIVMNTDTGAPGGLALSRDTIDSTDRYLGYLVYNPKFQAYADNDDENTNSHNVKAAAQYNAPGGLFVEFAGKYADASEKRGEAGIRESDDYNDMLYDLTVKYDFSPKLFVEGSFSGYDIEYDLDVSRFRDRTDNSWSLSTGYRITSKTEFAVEYKKTEIDYDQSLYLLNNQVYSRDSDLEQVSGNVTWDITAKSQGKVKLGRATKSFDNRSDDNDLFAELNISHDFTTRTSLRFAAARSYYETNFNAASYYVSDRISLFYSQELTPRITGKVNLYWIRDDYEGFDMTNDKYQLSPAAEYSFNDWLSAEAGYTFETRDSDNNVRDIDYNTNRFYVNVQGQF